MTDDIGHADLHPGLEPVLAVETHHVVATPVTVWRLPDGGHAFARGPSRHAPENPWTDDPNEHWHPGLGDWTSTYDAARLSLVPIAVAAAALDDGPVLLGGVEQSVLHRSPDQPAAADLVILDSNDAAVLLDAARRARAAALAALEVSDRQTGGLTPDRRALADEAAALTRAVDRLADAVGAGR